MTFKDEQGVVTLTPGINYFLVTADIAQKAIAGNKIKISVPSFKLEKPDILRKLVTVSLKKNHGKQQKQSQHRESPAMEHLARRCSCRK